jgi:hypothetical protein
MSPNVYGGVIMGAFAERFLPRTFAPPTINRIVANRVDTFGEEHTSTGFFQWFSLSVSLSLVATSSKSLE